MGIWFFCTIIWIGAHAHADVDVYNTYLWNRDNALAQNGVVDRGDWFEWWYFKVVDPDTREAFLFTYGVVNPWDTTNSLAGTQAVVQVGDFAKHLLVESAFPVTSFNASYATPYAVVDNSLATDQRIYGQTRASDGGSVSWDLTVTKNWAFNAMGWAMSVPDISGIYWYPAQASATMTGWVQFRGRTVQFDHAPGYQDRNWGRAFPKWWTWLTSNHFQNSPGTILAAGGGEPKIFNSVYLFSGLCIGLHYQDHDYIFRTTDGDSVKFDIEWEKWNVVAENHSREKIEIFAYAPPEDFMMLPFHSPRGPIFYDYEALLGQITVKLSKWSSQGWQIVALLETHEAGIEWGTPEPVDSRYPYSLNSLFNSVTELQK